MQSEIKKLHGGNLDLDLIPRVECGWEQDACPWNLTDGTTEHRCAVKNTSICDYFRGIEYVDTILCSYPNAIEDE